MHSRTSAPDPGRRRSLALLVNSLAAAVSGGLATLLGIFAVRPGAAVTTRRWVRAAALDDLAPDVPSARLVAIPRDEGWYRMRGRALVFLVWDGARGVRALSATCTHLGCQVRWEPASQRFLCPCHGGAYAIDGSVAAGPPPGPLPTVPARLDSGERHVLVEL